MLSLACLWIGAGAQAAQKGSQRQSVSLTVLLFVVFVAKKICTLWPPSGPYVRPRVRWRRASNRMTLPATPALSDSARPSMGMAMR